MDWSSIRLVTTTIRAARRLLRAYRLLCPLLDERLHLRDRAIHTVKSKPAFNMHWAMFEPMLPKPMNATFMMVPRSNGSCDFLLRNARHQDTSRCRHCSRVRFWPFADIGTCTACLLLTQSGHCKIGGNQLREKSVVEEPLPPYLIGVMRDAAGPPQCLNCQKLMRLSHVVPRWQTIPRYKASSALIAAKYSRK